MWCGSFFYACPLCWTLNWLGSENLYTKSLVDNIEKLLVGIYFYFSQFGKRIVEFERLVALLDVKALKILWNAQMCWLSMFSPTKQNTNPSSCKCEDVNLHMM